uniref:Uncharacterized protein n=1 Tax=Oryza glumipatula TaxID=40148 RepID=A0A0D9ZTT9_9ORYZ
MLPTPIPTTPLPPPRSLASESEVSSRAGLSLFLPLSDWQAVFERLSPEEEEGLLVLIHCVPMDAKGVNDRDALIDLESGNNIVVGEHNNGADANFAVAQERTAPNGAWNGAMGTSGCLKDDKLLNELSELAILKRARIERMKALKKMKNAKHGSSSGNLFPLIITIIFCLVILWQGFFSRTGSAVSFHGSPESSVRAHSSLISIRFYKNNNSNSRSREAISAAPKNAETPSRLEIHSKARKITR